MFVGLHTHYQMHLASKFTLFFLQFNSTQAFYLQIQSIFIKTNTFYKKLPIIIKNYIGHTYKKLQPQISAFIKNSIFEINRDPWILISNYALLSMEISKAMKISMGINFGYCMEFSMAHGNFHGGPYHKFQDPGNFHGVGKFP